jgi:hypothetical protein
MKIKWLALSLLALSFSTEKSTAELSLEEALKTKSIAIEASGNSSSTHYLKPLQLSIHNLKNEALRIRVLPGYHFQSLDSNVQDIITTQEDWIVLNPGESKAVDLAGMCIEQRNAAPGQGNAFRFAGLARKPLKEMSEYISNKNLQNTKGQYAMWSISDNDPLDGIIELNNAQERELMQLSAALSGRAPLSDEQCKKLAQFASNQVYISELKGTFNFSFSRPVAIHIALFSENGIVLKEIYKKTAPAGRQSVTYTFDANPHLGTTIYARLIAEDQVLLSRKIEL